MAVTANTQTTYNVPGLRESLENMIYVVADTETPHVMAASRGGKERTKNPYHEWQVQALAARNPLNANLQGDTISTFDSAVVRERVGNYTQLMFKSSVISDSASASDFAGANSPDQFAYDKIQKTKELINDLNSAIASNNASVAPSGSTAGVMGGFEAWLTTNTSRGAGGADGGFNSITRIVNAATLGASRPLTEVLLQDVIASIRVAGGNPDCIIMSPYQRAKLSAMGANLYRTENARDKRLTTGIDVYVSNFGELDVYADSSIANTGTGGTARYAVHIIDSKMLGICELLPLRAEDLAKDGSNRKALIQMEASLIMRNERAHGIVADVY